MRLSLFKSLDDLIQNCWDNDKWIDDLAMVGLAKYCSLIFEQYGYETGKKIIAWCTYCFSSDSERFFLQTDFLMNIKIVANEFDIDSDLLARIQRDNNINRLCDTILCASADKNTIDFIQLRRAKNNLLTASVEQQFTFIDATDRKAYYSTIADCAIKANKIGERLSKLDELVRKKLEVLNEASEKIASESFEERVLRITAGE